MTTTMYVFKVRYANGEIRTRESQVPFKVWTVRSGNPADRKAQLIGNERKVEVETLGPPSGVRL